jgi:hypothetical protein
MQRNGRLTTLNPARTITYLVLLVAAAHLYMHCTLSLKSAYDKIQLGSTPTEVQQVFRQYDIICGEVSPPGIGLSLMTSSRCVFQDPWRKYLIQSDRQSGRVVSKMVINLRPGASHAIILKIIDWIRR